MTLKVYRLKRIRAVTLFSALCLSGISGCTKPSPVEFGKVCQPENDKKYISVEGYLRTGVSVLCSTRNGTRTCGLELTDKPDGENNISVYVEEGTSQSQMEPLPKNYGKDSLKLHTSDGRVAGPQDRVRVIGKSSTATDAMNASYTVCYIDVDKIEKP